ncbi:MAG TPA: glutamate synthase subunit beta [Anaeromyxobacteraceae bacterium]|nr:glutamate synthase subunit beta [Anaeromyxobacteraceae bacterium]
MGKPTGFMEYEREPAHDRSPLERIKDWNEFHDPVPVATLQTQGARCMDCGLPFCHTGKLIAGMASGCPINNLIPEWNDLVYRGQWREALIRLHKTNNFPEFTGRVCPAPCEGSCTVGLSGDPVTIKSIEAAIIDRAFQEGWVEPDRPQTRTGHKVAVVGSGPAGLACAAQLNRAGHSVTVFERADRIGGLLTYGIPNMKLDKGIVQRRVNLIADSGVRFITGMEVGRHLPTRMLLNDYDAAVLCIGATKARDLPVEGRKLQGIHLAMDFLSQNTKSLLDSKLADERYLSAKARNVVVIGGGDTGTDCVGTSIRHGARTVTQFEILARPPDRRAPDNPWPQWPKVHKMDYGQEEAKELWGQDPRVYCISTKQFLGDGDGRVRELETVQVEWVKGPDGRLGPREIPGTEKSWPADLVLLALGFVGPEKEGLLAELGVRLDERGNVWTDEDKATSVPGVFAAGDASRGQSLVVWAIHEGRRAARGVDKFLMQGESYLPG